MKVLLITPNDITSFGGGSLGAKKFYLALKDMKQEFYIYSPSSVEETILIANKNKKIDIASRLLGHSNYMYLDWKKNKKRVLSLNPDVVILTNSRLGFIAKDIKSSLNNCKVVTHFDNIEFDYCLNYIDKFSGLKKVLMTFLEKKVVLRDESYSCKYSDHIIFLTQRDRKRASELYNLNKNVSLIPVCLEKKDLQFKPNDKKLNFVFLASLWYKPNFDGIMWFIKNVWKNIDTKEYSLIIGGQKPSSVLMNYNGVNNIHVYPNFRSMEDIVPKNSVFISPIFEGSGMKVKIAEALSYGFPIVATDESLVGYEEAFSDTKNQCVYKFCSNEDFMKAMYEMNKLNFESMNGNSIQLYEEYYSIDRVSQTLKDIIIK